MESILLIDTLKREETKVSGRRSVEGAAAAGGRAFLPGHSHSGGWAGPEVGELPSTRGLL